LHILQILHEEGLIFVLSKQRVKVAMVTAQLVDGVLHGVTLSDPEGNHAD
jgi:hypothetical protein